MNVDWIEEYEKSEGEEAVLKLTFEALSATLGAVVESENQPENNSLKNKLTEILVNEITPVAKEIQKLLDDKSHLKQILKKGSEKANIIAEENLKKIRDIVGLL